jgi:hypothetical protein
VATFASCFLGPPRTPMPVGVSTSKSNAVGPILSRDLDRLWAIAIPEVYFRVVGSSGWNAKGTRNGSLTSSNACPAGRPEE